MDKILNGLKQEVSHYRGTDLNDRSDNIDKLISYIQSLKIALTQSHHIITFYENENNYYEDSGAPGTWKLCIGKDLGVIGEDFIKDNGEIARSLLRDETYQQAIKLLEDE